MSEASLNNFSVCVFLMRWEFEPDKKLLGSLPNFYCTPYGNDAGEIEIGSEFEQLFCQLKQGRRQLRAALRSVQAVKPVKLLLFDILARGLGLGFWCCLGNMFELPPPPP